MRRPLALALLGPALLAPALAAAQAPEPGEADADLPHRRVLTREDVLRLTPVDPRALASPVAEFRELAEQVARGSTDPRLLRSYWRLSLRLFPFDVAPPADLHERALRAKQALAGGRADAPPPADGCWYPLGPRNIPGRMTAVELHPSEPQTVFAGAADGGVWKTTDLGATWRPLGDFEATLAIGALAVDPADPRVIYAGTGEGNYAGDNLGSAGLLKSSDGGATWSLITTIRSQFHELRIDPRSRSRLWAATRAGLFRSDDAGLNWTAAGGGLPALDATSVVVSRGTPGVVLAGIGLGFGTNAATGLYRSADDGATWTLVPSFPSGGDNGRLVIAQSAADPRRVYAAVASTSSGGVKGVYRSDDEGATWTRVGQPMSTCSNFCWYCLVIAADAGDPDTVYLGGVSIYRSTNAGQSYTRINNTTAANYVHVDQHELFSPAADTLWSANDGGLNVTRDGGATWDYTGLSLETAQYYHVTTDPTDDTFLAGGTQDQGTHRFRGGTSSWSSILGGDGAFTAIDPVDPRVWYASYQYLQLHRSRNRGTGMVQVFDGTAAGDPVAFIAPYALDRATPSTIHAGTNRIWRSTDQGDTWAPASPTLTTASVVTAIDNCRDQPASIWVGTGDGRVWNTQDAGSSWSERTAGLPQRAITSVSAHPGLPGTAYVSLGGTGTGHVWRTDDAGATWRDVSAGLPDIHFNRVLVLEDVPDTVLAGADLGLYRSDDGGTSWAVYGTELPNVAVDWITYSPITGTVRAGTHGRGAWQIAPAGTCPTAPDFAGLAAVAAGPASGCEPELSWSPARPTCALAPTVTYNVYRSTDPLFVTDASSLAAAGLTATTWRDAGVPPDVTHYYAVRAEDGQTGLGGPANGGREDRNPSVLRVTLGDPVVSGSFADDGGDRAARLSSSAEWSVGDAANSTPAGRFGYASTERGSSAHNPDVCASLVTPALTLGPGATLSYRAGWNLEEGWDGVVVEISTDGGATWSDLPPAGGYPGSFAQTQGNACGFPASRRAFSGPAGNAAPTALAPHSSSLAGFAGQTVQIRWRLSSDGGLEYEGFRLDDVSVAPVVGGAAAPAMGNVLVAAKEAGGTRFAWTDAAGAEGYRVWHSLDRTGLPRDLAGTAASGSPGLLDAAARGAAVHFFRLHSYVGCTEGS